MRIPVRCKGNSLTHQDIIQLFPSALSRPRDLSQGFLEEHETRYDVICLHWLKSETRWLGKAVRFAAISSNEDKNQPLSDTMSASWSGAEWCGTFLKWDWQDNRHWESSTSVMSRAWYKVPHDDQRIWRLGFNFRRGLRFSLSHTEQQVSYLSPGSFNPFIPKFEKYIPPTFSREMYRWGSENW